MSIAPDFLIALIAMACASYACRAGGFAAMGLVRITPRIEAALKAIPLGVMIGIATPAALSGKPPELAGIVAAGLAMKLMRNDFAAAFVGVGVVAGMRMAGW